MHYLPKSHRFALILLALWPFQVMLCQLPKIFTTKDFDLKGPVKSCVVVTSYGQEEFDFDSKGRLIKSKTAHSNSDHDITYYKYSGNDLIERRDEVYRDNTFDRSSSMAHIYSRDTTDNQKLTESIISYTQVNMEQFEYFFDPLGHINKIVRTDHSGVDETHIERDTAGIINEERYFLNEELVKAIRHVVEEDMSVKRWSVTLLEGEAQNKQEVHTDSLGRILREIEWSNLSEGSSEDPFQAVFTNRVEKIHEYDMTGLLTRTITLMGNAKSEEAYLHQLDGSPYGNWVKQIVTPENRYTTRIITYYPREKPEG